ncbi:MAG: RNA polymerase sporulation sigma factor SigE [Anaerovoracaceae bacterium]|jgi:RNA polymerase sporulation-specific sigma factor
MKIISIRDYLYNKLSIAALKRKAKRGIFYIGGSSVLPPPLSPEAEKQFMKSLNSSDERISKSAKSALIEHNLRLVVYIAKKFDNAGVNIEDLISIGTIGLIKAVNTFNVDKNIKLATYASRCIENEILMYLRHSSRFRSEVSFDEPLNVDWDGNELLLSDILGTDGDIIHTNLEEEVNRELLHYVLRKLTPREKQIMEMRFGLISGIEMTQKEVADHMGISQSYISRLEKKIIGRLQKEIRKLG